MSPAPAPAALPSTDAVEAVPGPAGAPVLLCCEHASARVPAPWSVHPEDAPWMATHWAIDLGARALTLDLAARLGAPALLARFSRLLCDANRPPAAPDLARAEVEGHRLHLNRGIDAAERARRVARFHTPYHAALDAQLAPDPPQLLFSVHTFTPRYLDEVRTVQLGVLFDLHDALGARFAALLAPAGLETACNAPWSGKAGLAYSPDRHGRAAGVPYLELEVRNDLLATPDQVARIGTVVADALRALLPEVAALR